MSIRVMLVDDHAIVRAGLKAVIGAAPGMTVVGEAEGGNAAVALLAHTPADVVVMDLSMAEGDGLTATRAITREGGSGARVLVLTMHSEESYLEPVLAAGASGYLVKSSADREVVEACFKRGGPMDRRTVRSLGPSVPRSLGPSVPRSIGPSVHRSSPYRSAQVFTIAEQLRHSSLQFRHQRSVEPHQSHCSAGSVSGASTSPSGCILRSDAESSSLIRNLP